MEIITVSKGQLTPNKITEKLYGKFSNSNIQDYDLLKSIEKNGIKEPLIITSDFYVISGNRRLAAVNQLPKINFIDVIVKDILKKDVTELMIIEHQLQRKKDVVMVAWEYEKLTRLYGIKSGVKNRDTEIENREEILKVNKVSESTIGRVFDAKKYYMKLHSCSENKAWEDLKTLCREKSLSADGLRKLIFKQLADKQNEEAIKNYKDYEDDWFQIFHRSNTNLRDIIEDDSIDCVMTSPPYFQLRVYQEDTKKEKGQTKKSKAHQEKQLGLENSPEDYIENLMKSFDESIRTLKDTGSIWVNIMDVRSEGEILDLPSELIRAFKKRNMKCVERCIWVKTNPPFNDSKTYQASEEFVLHFVKDVKKYKWYNNWFGKEDDFLGKITYGDKEKNRRFKNIFIYPNPKEDGVGIASGLIETTVINNSYLVKLMRKNGLELQHSALFPMELPLICILSTTISGNTVMDNFNGLATTGLIAYAHGCKYYGIEVSKEYAVQSKIRLKDFLENNPHLKRPSKGATNPKKSVKSKK